MSAAQSSDDVDPFIKYRVQARAAHGRATPYRIAIFMMRDGAYLPNPYPAGTSGHRCFAEGVKWERIAKAGKS